MIEQKDYIAIEVSLFKKKIRSNRSIQDIYFELKKRNVPGESLNKYMMDGVQLNSKNKICFKMNEPQSKRSMNRFPHVKFEIINSGKDQILLKTKLENSVLNFSVILCAISAPFILILNYSEWVSFPFKSTGGTIVWISLVGFSVIQHVYRSNKYCKLIQPYL